MTLKLRDFPPHKRPLVYAINIVGTPSEFAKRLGVNRQNVDCWLKRNHVAPPVQFCKEIEGLTQGKVTKERLRPDIFG